MKIGSVHGRFQPFHNGHLDYALQAFDLAEFVWVGLTQIFRPSAVGGVAKRDSLDSNPLSFLDRSEIVEAALVSAGIRRDRFQVTPFPIERPETLGQFIPAGCVCFTTLVNEWNDEKVRRLNDNGFPTKILATSQPDNMRVNSGTEIRRLIRAGDPTWARFVPGAVAEMIDTRLRDRF